MAAQNADNKKVVSFHYTLKDESGAVLESSHGEKPLSYLEGGGQIIPGLESELRGMKKGDKKNVNVAAKDAYGEHDQELIVKVPRGQIPKKDVEVGDQFHAHGPDGEPAVVTVTAVDDQHVTVDGNHPLAGQALTFDVEIAEVRDATSEEVAHGHAHGPGGHHHHG